MILLIGKTPLVYTNTTLMIGQSKARIFFDKAKPKFGKKMNLINFNYE